MQQNKYAVFSANDNPEYSFYIPLAARLWERAGFRSIVLMPCEEVRYRLNFTNHETIKKYCPEDTIFRVFNSKGYNTGTLAQVSRLAGYKVAPYGSYVITSDSDMLPLDPSYFQRDFTKAHLYGYDLTGHSQFPMCYAGMLVQMWERLMWGGGNLDMAHKAYYLMETNAHKSKSEVWEQYWDTDQTILTKRVMDMGLENFDVIDRGFENGLARLRVDRYGWNYEAGRPYIDAHLLKNPTHTENFAKTVEMLNIVVPDFDTSWMAGYYDEFCGNLR